MYEYRAFGMRIESELALALPLALPLTPLSAPRGFSQSRREAFPEWRVSIGLGTVKKDPALSQKLGRVYYGESGKDFQVEVPWAGRFRVRGDSRIDVEPEPSADERTVGLYITGFVLSFLLRRHPFLTLHGSAVTGLQGKALVFLGERGSGKSTTAAALTRLGYKMLCDDVVPVASGPVIFPGIPFPKLLPDAYEHLIGDSALASDLFDGTDKYQVELAAGHTPAALKSVFILEPAEIAHFEMLPLRGAAKIAAIIPHICSTPGIDDVKELFTRCVERLGQGAVYRVRRPIAGYCLPELIGAIIRMDKGENL